MKKKDQGPEVLSEEEFNEKYKSAASQEAAAETEEAVAEPKSAKKKRRMKIASFRDILFLGALTAATALTYTQHGKINDMTDCYLSRFTDNVCFVQKPADEASTSASYSVRAGSTDVVLGYDSQAGNLSIDQASVNRELAGYSINVQQALDAMFQNQENRYTGVNHVVRSMNSDEWRINADYATRQIMDADKRTVQEIVINDILNNPKENESALTEIAEQGARLRPDIAVTAIPNDSLVNEGKKRGIDVVLESYDVLLDFLRSQYESVSGSDEGEQK
ncbi:MAG: hypothetical protein KKE20_00360 [Nanoarchaeota archaeon]|nr:hypothetical protein [Nanoarchaeota archaeon]